MSCTAKDSSVPQKKQFRRNVLNYWFGRSRLHKRDKCFLVTCCPLVAVTSGKRLTHLQTVVVVANILLIDPQHRQQHVKQVS